MATDPWPRYETVPSQWDGARERPLLKLRGSRFLPAAPAWGRTSAGVRGGMQQFQAGFPTLSHFPKHSWSTCRPVHIQVHVYTHTRTHKHIFYFWTFSHIAFFPLKGLSFYTVARNKSLCLKWGLQLPVYRMGMGVGAWQQGQGWIKGHEGGDVGMRKTFQSS